MRVNKNRFGKNHFVNEDTNDANDRIIAITSDLSKFFDDVNASSIKNQLDKKDERDVFISKEHGKVIVEKIGKNYRIERIPSMDEIAKKMVPIYIGPKKM